MTRTLPDLLQRAAEVRAGAVGKVDRMKTVESLIVDGVDLPVGWRFESPAYEPDCIMLTPGGGMWITVDYKQRIFGLGYDRPRPWRESISFSIKGPNWRGRLVRAAVEYLESETGTGPLAQLRQQKS